jgi:uncharacterized protein YcaQ
LPAPSLALSPATARAIWLRAQRLDEAAPFGQSPDATRRAVEHLGYVQIDTINVIERSHHHILQTRIPEYARTDLESAQSTHKSVFEYWTHALSYIPVADYPFFMAAMNRFREAPPRWFSAVDTKDYAALLRRIRKEGALSIRDIDDEVLVDKTHPWGSRKPSKGALRLGFFTGDLAISKRTGMLKSYDLARRHFEWQRKPRAASETNFAKYLLERAIRSQGIVSLDSICYGNLATKPLVVPLIESAVRRKRLIAVHLEGHEQAKHWAPPEALDTIAQHHEAAPLVHVLSPFDPLVIQRKRLQLFFGYEHRFEAYVPPDKRVMGYFALPVLMGDEIVAAIDLKTDRQARKLIIQKWTWIARKRTGLKTAVEETLQRFERFQLT